MIDDMGEMDSTLETIVAEARRPVALDPGARERLMAAIRSEPVPARDKHRGWLLAPRAVALPPIASFAMAAGLVALGLAIGRLMNNRVDRPAIGQPAAVAASPQLPDSAAARAVRFVLIAPQASHVSVVGDFNGWDGAATPAVRQPDGSWTAYVPLVPGRHVYSFVVDGSHFVADPTAPIAPDDGYGQQNSVVIVAGATS